MEERKPLFDNLSKIEKAWISANTFMNSNEVQKSDGIIDTENISTLSDYLKSHPIESMGISQDTMDDDRLKKTYVVPITVTDPSYENGEIEIYLIVDSRYKDLAVIDKRNENGFRITDNVKNNIMEKIMGSSMLKNGLIDKDTLVKELMPSQDFKLKDLAETVAKGEKLEPRDDRDILRRHNKQNGIEISKEEMEYEKEEKEREEVESSLPKTYKDKIIEYCEKTGMKVSDLKQVMTVQNPKSVTDLIEGENLNPKGEPVVVLRFKNKEINAGSDEIVMIQGNKVEKRDKFNEPISRAMEDRAKSNTTIKDLVYDEDQMIQYRDENGDLIVVGIESEQLDTTISNKDAFVEKLREIMAKRELNLQRAGGDPDLVNSINEGTTSEINSLCEYYGVGAPEQVLPDIIEEIESEKEVEDDKGPDDGWEPGQPRPGRPDSRKV